MASSAALHRHRALRREEAAGLAVALAAHVGLVAWLALKPPAPAPLPVPERMTVTISDQIAEKSTSPDPKAEAAPAIAPVVAENPVPEPAPNPQPQPQPQVQPQPAPRPAPRVAPAPPPRPVPAPRPQPAPRAAPQPQPRAAPAKPAPQPPKPVAKPAGGGGSRIGSDFLKGLAGGQTLGAKANAQPAEAAGPEVQSAIRSAIARQLKPHWVAPQGADAEQLVTIVRFHLARDGSLQGVPEVVGQSGITDANRAQAPRHAEQAIRAVRLAAPFDLPDRFYSAWQTVTSRFDKRLSQ